MTDESSWALVMPFVVCQSYGGPYEDTAFVAGIYYGQVIQLLNARPARHIQMLPTPLRPQLELLAMNDGYSMAATDTGYPGWIEVAFTRLT